MNLKFEEVCCTKEPELMYVVFRNNGQKVRWYPKWDELRRIIQSAIFTEGSPNNWQSSELDKFKDIFKDMTVYIDFRRSEDEAIYR